MLIPIPFGTPAYDAAIQLRDEVLRRPLGLSFTAEALAQEADQIHLGWYSPELELLGCLVFVPMEGGKIYKMRQVAVLPTYQRKGIGSQLVKASEKYALEHGCEHIMMHARQASVPFYTQLGYEKYGRKFQEVTLPHYKMRKDLGVGE